jgi:hypothetical protein
MGWIMKALDGMETKRQRKELETFLAGLRSMSDAEIAELIVFATHTRHGLEQSGHNVLDPLTLNITKPHALPELIKLIQQLKAKGNEAAAAALMVWAHSMRAALRGELLPLGREMWRELARGFVSLPTAKNAVRQRVGTDIDVSDADRIPAGFA